MNKNKLILLSRSGCCLCKGLEERISNLSLELLDPPLLLCVVNIDEPNVPKSLKDRYALEVPVLILELANPLRRLELPRVSPRLSEEDLFLWLEKIISKKLETRKRGI